MAKRKRAATKKKRAATKKKRPTTGKPSRSKPEGPSVRTIQDAIDRARDWLSQRRDYYGYLSRRDSGRGAPELAGHLRGDLLAHQGRDGSWAEGHVAATADAIWRLLDFGMTSNSRQILQAIHWLYGRRDAPGAFSSGCTPARHDAGICEHFIGGFFSPASPEESLEITLDNGQTVNSDVGARLLISERTLRSLLRAGANDPRTGDSVTGLRSLPIYLEYGGSFTPAVLVGALQSLGWVQGPRPSELDAGLEVLAAAQDKDGIWPNVEFFFVLETLLEVEHPLTRKMLRRAVPRLLETQHKYGAWGRNYVAPQTWIAARVLELVMTERREAAKAR